MIYNKKGIFIILLILADLSLMAQINNNNIIGKYCRAAKHGCIPSRYMEIFPDSVFFYWGGQPGGVISKGSWYISDNKLILNSEIQPEFKNDDYLVEEIPAISDTQTTIHIKNEFDEPIPFAECVVTRNGESIESMSDLDGNITFNFTPLKQIEIVFPGLKPVHFINRNSSPNNYIFILKEQDDYYQHFTNEIFIIKGKRLYCEKTKKPRKKNTLYKIKNYYKKLNE